jgi:ribonuclease P protein component
MLGADHRMRRRADFDLAFGGLRAGTRTLLVAVSRPGAAHKDEPEPTEPAGPALVGFVVSRAVGGAVQRNLVKRRLRHAAAEHIDRIPPGRRVVVRAQPTAVTASYEQLAGDLTSALGRAGGLSGAPS